MHKLDKNLEYLEIKKTSGEVKDELESGLRVMSKINTPLVSFFGGHLAKPGDADFKHCQALATELGKRGIGVITGGGPGIMEAANLGAKIAGAPSIGVRASLIKNEEVKSPAYTDIIPCKYIFIRRFLLAIKSEALIFYPGGFGTFNELFEYVVLVQTGVADKVPVICVGKDFWNGLFEWVKKDVASRGFLTNGAHDLSLIKIVDDQDEILKILGVKRR